VRWHRCRRSQDYAPRLIVGTAHKLVEQYLYVFDLARLGIG
jgi:hypothetical protein